MIIIVKYKKLCLMHGLCARDKIYDFPPPPTTSTEGWIKKFITATVSVSSHCTVDLRALCCRRTSSSIQNSTRLAWSRHFDGRGEMGEGGGGKECGSPRDEWNMLVPSPWHSSQPSAVTLYPHSYVTFTLPSVAITSRLSLVNGRTDAWMNEWMAQQIHR